MEVKPKTSLGNCPYCHNQVNRSKAVLCPVCGRPHHTECWADNNNHCGMHNCLGQTEPTRGRRTPLAILAFTAIICSFAGLLIGWYGNLGPILGGGSPPSQSPYITTTLSVANFSATATEIMAQSSRTPTKKPATSTDSPTSTKPPTQAPIKTDSPSNDPSACSKISRISSKNTPQGKVLTIICSNGVEYDMPPISGGGFEIGPNQGFFVYCTIDGYVYAGIAGDTLYKSLENIRPKVDFDNLDDEPILSISFLTGSNQYWAVIYESLLNERTEVKIPIRISGSNIQ
jgi:hypothetical protein